MLERVPRPGRRAALTSAVVTSAVLTGAVLLALVAILAVVASALLLGRGTGAAELHRVGVLTGTAAAASFGLATLLLARTRRLTPALWGYLPGLVCAVASGLAVGAV